jgi:hypothetical protein
LFTGSLMTAVGKPHYALVSSLGQWLIIGCGFWLVNPLSVPAAMMIWALRLIVSMPIDLAMFRRASGISLWRQIKGMTANLPVALAMGGIVLATKAVLPPTTETVRLVILVATGAASYAGLLAVFRMPLLKRVAELTGVRVPGNGTVRDQAAGLDGRTRVTSEPLV